MESIISGAPKVSCPNEGNSNSAITIVGSGIREALILGCRFSKQSRPSSFAAQSERPGAQKRKTRALAPEMRPPDRCFLRKRTPEKGGASSLSKSIAKNRRLAGPDPNQLWGNRLPLFRLPQTRRWLLQSGDFSRASPSATERSDSRMVELKMSPAAKPGLPCCGVLCCPAAKVRRNFEDKGRCMGEGL